MKENVYSLFLFTVEAIILYIFNLTLQLPTCIMIKMSLLWFVIMFIFKHYKVESTLVWDEIKNEGKALVYFCLISAIFIYPYFYLYWKLVVIGILMCVMAILVNRTLRILLRRILARKTLVIGAGNDAQRIGMIANNNRFALTQVMGFVKINDEYIDDEFLEFSKKREIQLYDYDQLDEILNHNHYDQIIVSIADGSNELLDEITKKIFGKVKIIKVAPKLNFTMTFNSKINDFDGILLISTARGKLGILERYLKRIIDICAGIVGCSLLLPLTFYVRHQNKKNGDNEDIFFKQERIGLNGKPIYIYKYRSMIPNAEQVLEELMEKDPAIKEEYLTNKKLVNDPRITKVGHFLRKTSLDEFPQFINVLKGEMSLVGPRPYLPREKEDMDIYYQSIIKCKPGITGMWQANGRSDVGFVDRCQLDDYYFKNWTLGLDIVLIYKTIKGVIYGKGAL